MKRAGLRAVPAAMGPLVLGLETGGDHLAASLVELRDGGGYRLRDAVVSYRGHRHADAVLLRVHAMLEQQGVGASELGLIAVGRGPGGFTGVRVGLATALGLSLGSGAPVWPVCSLLSLALEAAAREGHGPPRLVAAVIDARRGEVYAALFSVAATRNDAIALVPPLVCTLADLDALVRAAVGEDAEVLWVGSGAVAARRVAPGTEDASAQRGSATRHALIAAAAFDAVGRDPTRVPPLDAAYLRKSEAEINAEKALARRAAMGD